MAAAAGVSYQTVSRVINDHPSVKPTTRELVLAAIEDLGFRPNRAARALAGGPPVGHRAHAEHHPVRLQAALQGIEEAARAAGFAVGIRRRGVRPPQEVADARCSAPSSRAAR